VLPEPLFRLGFCGVICPSDFGANFLCLFRQPQLPQARHVFTDSSSFVRFLFHCSLVVLSGKPKSICSGKLLGGVWIILAHTFQPSLCPYQLTQVNKA
jgi:hypothetical protein